MKIITVKALEILDSRGTPSVKAYVELQNGVVGTALVPSGASTGSYEARELRDNDKKRYLGKGVQSAIKNIEKGIAKTIVNHPVEKLKEIDNLIIDLDGTQDKSRLGANATLAVSLACVRAYAEYIRKPLWKTINKYYFTGIEPAFPQITSNIINGGKHAGWNFPMQEFMIVPIPTSPSQSIRIASEIFQNLKKLLSEKGLSILVGDEGGFSPKLPSSEKALDIIIEAAEKAGYTKTVDYCLAIDAAASEFYKNAKYYFDRQNREFTSEKLTDYYLGLINKYPLVSLEDPHHEDDWAGFSNITSKIGDKCLIVGDDLYTTNSRRIEKGILGRATNAIIIKPNQIGTLSETVDAIKLSRQAKWKISIAHRSGDTEDPFIADLAVACASDFIKTGSMSRSERLVKYNRLLEIERFENVRQR